MEEAEAAARKAIALMPDQQEGYAALAVVLTDRGNREAALAEMKNGVAIDPKDPQSHMALGKLLERLEQYEGTIASFETSAKLAPGAAPLIRAADAYTELKRAHDALSSLRRATEVKPQDSEAWMAYSVNALELRDARRAESAFERAILVAPNASAPLLKLASLFIQEKTLSSG